MPTSPVGKSGPVPVTGGAHYRASRSEAEIWRLVRRAAVVSAAAGIAILAAGVLALVLAGHSWPVMGAVGVLWACGLLHLGLLARTARRARVGMARGRAAEQ